MIFPSLSRLIATMATAALACAPAWAGEPIGRHPLVVRGSQGLIYSAITLSETYAARTRGFTADTQIAGLAASMKGLTEGTVDIVLMDRDLLPEEEVAFTTKFGYPPSRIAFAMDALVVLVNKNNPIKSIRVEQFDAAFSMDQRQGWVGDMTVWGDLGLKEGWQGRPIQRVGRTFDSGNYWYLTEVLTLKGRPRLPIRGDMDAFSLMEELTACQAAISYGNRSEKMSCVKIVPLVPKGSTAPVEATDETIMSGEYPLCRLLYAYVNRDPKTGMKPDVRGLLALALSPEGQAIVRNCGNVPLPKDILVLNTFKITGQWDKEKAGSLGN